MKNKQFFGLCSYYIYKVKIKYHSNYYCFTDFDGDAVFEKDNSSEQKTLSGFELLKMFSEIPDAHHYPVLPASQHSMDPAILLFQNSRYHLNILRLRHCER